MSDFESQLYTALLYGGFGVAAIVFVALLFISAPYGRYNRPGWGPTIPDSAGWLIMEIPASLFVPLFFLWGAGLEPNVAWVLVGFWVLHYGYRGWVYPFRRRDTKKRMALTVALMGVVFNLFNGYMNGRYIGLNVGSYTDTGWLTHPKFLIGAGLFVIGLAINHHADHVLRNLRKPGETEYKVPQGGLYRYISCPNYFGEIVEWIGWAVLIWSPAGLLFAVWTFANLFPRALDNHRWYRDHFDDYPPERKAVIPFVI